MFVFFFDDEEPHLGRALWTHPWEVNPRYMTQPDSAKLIRTVHKYFLPPDPLNYTLNNFKRYTELE